MRSTIYQQTERLYSVTGEFQVKFTAMDVNIASHINIIFMLVYARTPLFLCYITQWKLYVD